MTLSFIVPPPLDGQRPAERTAGCTRMVYPMPNIYELTVAAVLEQAGFNVQYHDFVMAGLDASGLERFLMSDDSSIYLMWCVNLSLETDLVAARLIRHLRPSAYILMLGPGATFFPEKLLLDGAMVVVRGEPEETVRELVDCLAQNLEWRNCKGVTYLADGHLVRNPSRPLMPQLDQLPFPARHLISKYHYFNPKLKAHPYTTVLTSRNCPFQCIYCVPSSLTFAREIDYKADHGRKPPVSFHSVEYVVAELDSLAANGYRAIAFVDDNFIISAKRLKPICDALKRHGFLWGCQARVDAINEEVAQILGDTGCGFVDLGVESFDDKILSHIKKGVTSSQIYSGIALLKKYGVPVKLNILIGTSPLETATSIRETFKQTLRLGVSQVMFNIVAPFPGTEFYNQAKANGWIKGGEYVPTDVQRDSILNYPQLSSRQMARLLFWNNVRFFLRPSFVWMHVRSFHSWRDFVSALKALKIKLVG